MSGTVARLWKGHLKLVENLPPSGDAQWHPFDIMNDPGETIDLARAKSTEFLAMPPGYTAPEQILDNAIAELLWLRLRLILAWAGALLALIGPGIWLLKRQ